MYLSLSRPAWGACFRFSSPRRRQHQQILLVVAAVIGYAPNRICRCGVVAVVVVDTTLWNRDKGSLFHARSLLVAFLRVPVRSPTKGPWYFVKVASKGGGGGRQVLAKSTILLDARADAFLTCSELPAIRPLDSRRCHLRRVSCPGSLVSSFPLPGGRSFYALLKGRAVRKDVDTIMNYMNPKQ